MSFITLALLTITLFVFPLFSVLVCHELKKRSLKPWSNKTCFIVYSLLVVYYGLYFGYVGKLLNHFYPTHSETKMVCENKTTYWREGIKY